MAKPTLEAPPSAPEMDAPPPVRTPVRNIHLRRRNLWIWAFLMPTVVLYGLYTIYPIIASYWYSLVEWNGFESEQRFVGISNYEAVLADPGFWNSVWITLVFMLLVAPARVVLSLLLAIVLNSPSPVRRAVPDGLLPSRGDDDGDRRGRHAVRLRSRERVPSTPPCRRSGSRGGSTSSATRGSHS